MRAGICAALALAAFFVSPPALAGLRECGEFRVEGKIAPAGKETTVLLANEDSFARIEFRLKNSGAKGEKPQPGSRAVVVLRVESRCDFVCAGELVAVESLLEPWQSAREFNAQAPPLRKLECRN